MEIVNDITQLEIPCFMQKRLESDSKIMLGLLDEIKELIIDKLPIFWRMRYPARNFDLQIKCSQLFDISRNLEEWRQKNLEIDEKTFFAIRTAQLNRLKSMVLCDGEGKFYDKDPNLE